jgi:hypothetical protein
MTRRIVARARATRIAFAAALTLAVAGTAGAAAVILPGHVRAFDTNRHSLYVGRSEAFVMVRGDGDTDLDCWLYNPQGRLVASDTDGTDFCVLAAPDVGTHRLVIRNLGEVYNDYVIWKE